jgi:TatD DNase family protein
LSRAASDGLSAIVTIGTTASSSQSAVDLANRHPLLRAAVGIQPNYVGTSQPGDFETIAELAKDPRVVAIGETGLDRYWDHSPFDRQIEFFERHLALSAERDLPFIVHCREAEADVVAVLKSAAAKSPLRGVMHSYAGGWDAAQTCLDLGLYISFAGMLTYKKNDALRDVARRVPLDRVLVETDSPYLAPQPVRGKRNEPAWVKHTAACLAELHGLPLADLAARTTTNARALFRL